MKVSDDKEIRLSYTTLELYHSCKRKFELLRLRNPNLLDGYDETFHTMFGNAAHIGVQSVLGDGSLERALLKSLIRYDFNLWDDKENKTFHKLAIGLELFYESWDWKRYEIIPINRTNPVELSFKINLSDNPLHYYMGYMDDVLFDHKDNQYCVIEVKTTGLNLNDVEPFYRNSNQGLGSSIVLHSIDNKHKSFKVIYIVFQFRGKNQLPLVHILPFKYTLKNRLEWLQYLGMTYKEILDSLDEYELFPKNGSSCMNYFHRCPLYGQCDLIIPNVWSPIKGKPDDKFDFTFDIDNLIEEQINQLGE